MTALFLGSLLLGTHANHLPKFQHWHMSCERFQSKRVELLKDPNLLPEDTIDYEMDVFDIFKDSKKI